MECVLDTNVLVYDAIEDSELHEKAERILDKFERLLIPGVVIEEFVSVMSKLKIRKDLVMQIALGMLNNPSVELVPVGKNELEGAFKPIAEEEVSIRKFSDKVILYIAKRRKASFFTFDRELIQEQERLRVKSPL
jgi:predicted nucleic acid-binding protein